MGTLVTGDNTPAAAEPAAEPARTHPMEAKAAKLYDAPGPESGAAIGLRTAYLQHHETIADVLGETTEQRTQREQHHTSMMDATGLHNLNVDERNVGELLYDVSVGADIAAARGTTLTQADVTAMAEEARRALREKWGEDAEDLLSRANAFVKQHPTLLELTKRNGIGSRKDVVLALCEHVRTTNWRPKKGR